MLINNATHHQSSIKTRRARVVLLISILLWIWKCETHAGPD